jgi:hypothetical protein
LDGQFLKNIFSKFKIPFDLPMYQMIGCTISPTSASIK